MSEWMRRRGIEGVSHHAVLRVRGDSLENAELLSLVLRLGVAEAQAQVDRRAVSTVPDDGVANEARQGPASVFARPRGQGLHEKQHGFQSALQSTVEPLEERTRGEGGG